MIMMKMWCSLSTLFAIFLHVSHGKFAAEQPYVVGGDDAKPNEFPYMVSIQYNLQHHCGGSIIADDWILTAAHCFSNESIASDFTVLTGTIKLNSGGKRYLVKKIIRHREYHDYTNDITLLQLQKKISFDSSTDKINLPTQDTPGGTKVVLTGWGLIGFKPNVFTNTLKAVSLLTITNKECRDVLGSEAVPDGDICTYTKKGQGSCQGDSGGPLVDPKLNRQVGIVSGGVPCAKGYPDVFTRVYKYLDWINNAMRV